MNIKKTKCDFEFSGEIISLFYSNGENEKGKWNRLEITLKSDDNIIYTELFGIKTKSVKLYKVNSFNGLNFNDHLKVKWNDIHKISGYKAINQITINQEINLINHEAVEYISSNFNVGDLVFVKGRIDMSIYREQKQINFLIRAIDKIKSSVIIDKVNRFILEAIFERIENNCLIVRCINKKESDFIVLQHDLVINPEKKEDIINHFTYNVQEGELIKIYGHVENKYLTKKENDFIIITDFIFNQFICTSGYSLKEYYNLSILDSLHIESQEEPKKNLVEFNEYGF